MTEKATVQSPAAIADEAGAQGPLIYSGRSRRRSIRVADEGAVEWKPVAMAVGMPVLGIAIFGAIFGLSAASNVDALADVQPTEAAELPINLSNAPTEDRYASVDFKSVGESPKANRQIASKTAMKTARPVGPRPLPVPRPQSPTETASLTDSIAPPVEPVAVTELGPAIAGLPLPTRTVASTIGRIGYPCGAVASATAVEGAAAGVFKITCTSGHSYQASPVNGRYRFRRWREPVASVSMRRDSAPVDSF